MITVINITVILDNHLLLHTLFLQISYMSQAKLFEFIDEFEAKISSIVSFEMPIIKFIVHGSISATNIVS